MTVNDVFVKKLFFFFLFFEIFSFCLFSDSYSDSSKDEAVIMRVPVWVFLEPVPGRFDEENSVRIIPPKEMLKELSAYLLSGMIYGWRFSYTPFDKLRGVEEYFDLQPVTKIEPNDSKLLIKDLEVVYPYCYCWAEYSVSKSYFSRLDFWKTILAKTIQGSGECSLDEEINGIYTAYNEAVKNAVRQYLRKQIKNKPKEISGEVLIKANPRLYVNSGKFKSELEIYLKINEVVPYQVF